MINKIYLPIGTIIKLFDLDSKIMIIGYMMKDNKNIVSDYCGCIYPSGIKSKKEILYFNKNQITEIIKLGPIDGEVKKIIEFIEQKNK